MLTLSLLLLTSCGDKESQLFEFGLRIENSCSVDGLKSEDATSINIPITYDNRQVKYIGRNAFEGNEKLISVIIPEGVEYIESYAFKGCSNLENISLPNVNFMVTSAAPINKIHHFLRQINFKNLWTSHILSV